MAKQKHIALNFEIDRLTNSIENSFTGESLPTEVSPVTLEELKKIKEQKTWVFDWVQEHRLPMHKVYKLTTIAEPQTIQGLMSMELKPDHVLMHLIESAPINRGKNKIYCGVLGNLVAYACKTSFDKKYINGAVAFYAKTQLIEHYKKELGAKHVGGHLMILDGYDSLNLVNLYFSQTSKT